MAETRRFGRLTGPRTGLLFRPDVRDIRRQLGTGTLIRRGMQRALFEAHREAALRVQYYAAAELETRRSRRPRRPENVLHMSIVHPRNRNVTASGFEVGIESWLFHDSPAARYAKRIEFGGPNPMAAQGPIRGGFWMPGGLTDPDPAQQGRHGRVRWTSALTSTTSSTGRRGRAIRMARSWTISPNDVVAVQNGYRMHQRAGAQFLARNEMFAIYARHIRDNVPNWVSLRRPV